ncbi:fatty acid-binding protein, intestinal-like [Littorina saxatilis]|uniref:Uncharacterized protein n=1 Tax=Littorina saxatilis TaxID=31220 RepID=A0AAN9AWE9_9CAEN
MADAFIGKWKVDLSSTTGLDDFGAAIGFSAERIETYRKLSYTLEFTKTGDTFTATVTFDAEGIPSQTYSFKLGETFDYNSIDGTKPKLTITEEGGKIVEKYKLEDKDKEWETVREISGGVMTSTTTYGGKSVVQKLNKA